MTPIRPLLLAALTGLALALPVLPAAAAPPAPCARTWNLLAEPTRAAIAAWLKQISLGGDLSIDHVCALDGGRTVLALVDFNGLASAVWLMQGGEARFTKLFDGALESPAVLRPPGGANLLFFITQQPRNRLLLRRYALFDPATGARTLLYEGLYDPRRQGCANPGASAVLNAVAVRFRDDDRDGQIDLVIDHESVRCPSGEVVRREDVWLARANGYQRKG